LKRIIQFFGVITIVFFMTGCQELFEALAAPQGYVYSSETGEPISDVTVELKTLTGTVLQSATTNTNGYYSFSDVDYGKFELTATDDDTSYVYVKQIVEVSGISQTLPNIAGIPIDLDGDGKGVGSDLETGILTIVVFWDRYFQDVDAHLTFPNTDVGSAEFASTDFYNPITYSEDLRMNGFFPAETIVHTNRTIVHQDPNHNADVYPAGLAKTTTSLADLWLEVDNVGHSSQAAGGPETFTIFYPPSGVDTSYVGTWAYTSSGSGDPSGLEAGDYECIGVMEYYLDAWTDEEPATVLGVTSPTDTAMLSSTTNIDVASPIVYVFDGTNQIARYTLPQYTDIERAAIFRINMFLHSNNTDIYYQILPDTRVLSDDGGTTYGNIKSAQAAAGPVVVKARSRR